MTTSSYLEYVCREGNLSVFLDLWLPLIKNSDVSERSITFACALLPYCQGATLEKCFQLIEALVQRSRGLQVNTVLMLFSMLYAKPYFQVNRVLILNAFRYLFVSRYAITPIVNFLSIVCRQSGEVRDVAYALLRDLVTRFPSAFDVVKPLAVIGDSEPLDVLRSKLDLITALCVATDRSDELLPSISALLKKGAATVAAAMTVVKALCKEEILDVSTIRKQLGSRLRQPGFEEALAGYCDILATAASQPTEHDENFLRECVLELYEITKLRNCSAELRNARVAAWKALGSFGGALLTNVIDTSGSKLMEILLELHEEERKGFIAFLRNLIKEEVENLSRTLYTQVHVRKSSFSALTYSLHNSLGKSNQEAPWFWKATLPLFSVIAGEYGEEAAALQATRLFRRLLREVPTSQDDVIGLFSGWRISVASMLSLHISSGSILKARDGIVEECKRALTHSELTVNNVAVVIAVLAGELRRMGSTLPDSESSESFENSMRPWLIATLEFLFAIVHDGYAPTTPPLFQTVINRRCVNMTLVQSAVWMVCSIVPDKVRSFFDDKWFSSTNDWRIGAQMDPDCKLYNLLLTGTEADCQLSIQRFELWQLAAALGADELVTNGLSRLLSCDDSAEETINSVVDKTDPTVEDINDLFSKCSNLPLRSLQKHEPRLRKRLDQLSSRAGESMKRAIFEGLSKLASVSLLVTTVNLPADYSHLPEDSILRSVVAQFSSDSKCSREISHSLLSALVGHIRSDGRRLPPLDLQFLLSSIDFRADEEARLHVLTLGFEQKDALIIFELTSNEMLCLSSTLNAYWMTLSKNISFITTALPASRAEAVLSALFRFTFEAGSEEVNEVLSEINSLGENQVLLRCIVNHLPTFNSSADLLRKVLSISWIDKRFQGKVSKCFDFWLACNGLLDEKLSKLVDIYAAEIVHKSVMLSIFGYSSLHLDLSSRIDKLLSIMSIGNGMLNCNRPQSDIESVLMLFLATICSTPADVPLCWPSEDIGDIMRVRWRYYWKILIRVPKFCEQFDVMTAFLVACLNFEPLSPSFQDIVKGMLLDILASRPDFVKPYVYEKGFDLERLIS
ncbi:hypothetical protein Q1695_002233 [Nippostrongylus brasiliensis]|nr:hypothetical protein Q1695_002233 [Nippostrongylus brasiliensis]